jgi:two-component sensor histidine kinase
MGRLIDSQAIVLESGRTDGGSVLPFMSRFEIIAARSAALSPRTGRMLGVLLDATRLPDCAEDAAPDPLWTDDAMNRACNMAILVAQLQHRTGAGTDADRLAAELAGLYRALDVGQDDQELPCSAVLKGVVRTLLALFGPAAGRGLIETDIEPLSLPAAKRRALVLAASDLVVDALRHGIAGNSDGPIKVTLRTIGRARAGLRIDDDSIGFRENHPDRQSGIAGRLAAVLEAELIYRRSSFGGTSAEIVFQTGRR